MSWRAEPGRAWPGLAQSVCFVSGAGRGIGAAVARGLARHGARVAVSDQAGESAEAVARELREAGARAIALQMDVRERPSVERAMAETERSLGPLDIAVSAAGVLRTGAVVDCSDDDWDASFEVNARGVFYVSRAAAQRMLPRRSGVIIAIASNAAAVGRTRMAAYAASKAAVVAFTRCLGLELAAHGVRCNTVSPGSTDTPMLRSLWTEEDAPARAITGCLDQYRVGIPLGRLAEPDDIAEVVLFLASGRARHITMQNIHVDGGATLS